MGASILRYSDRIVQIPKAAAVTPDWMRVLRVYALGAQMDSRPVKLRRGEQLDLRTRDEVAAFWHIFAAHCYNVREDDRIIVDAGANIGLFALWAAGVAPNAKITSVEPNPESFARLQATVKGSQFSNRIKLIQSALGGDSEPKWLQDFAGESTAVSVQAENTTGGQQVQCMTLTKLFGQIEDTGEIDLLKMDIEASEYETLLATSRDVLRRIRRINVEMHVPGPVSAARRDKTLAYMKECGFELLSFDCDAEGTGIAFFERI